MSRTISVSDKMTQNFGGEIADLAVRFIEKKNGRAIIFLKGELGSGKTTFAKGFLRYFGIKPRNASPTFVIMKKYGINLKLSAQGGSATGGKTIRSKRTHLWRENLKQIKIYHIDFYRMRSKEDIKIFDIEKLFEEKNSIFLIEWPEKIGVGLAGGFGGAIDSRVWKKEINFSYGEKENERVIEVKPPYQL